MSTQRRGQSKVQWGDIILWGIYLARLEIARYVPSIVTLCIQGYDSLSSQQIQGGEVEFYGPLY